ncbi:FG-GAP repeat protein [Hydrogenophaga crocea]|nr:FG-GAP repeat protein [Hydrogenophaga crocea]
MSFREDGFGGTLCAAPPGPLSCDSVRFLSLPDVFDLTYVGKQSLCLGNCPPDPTLAGAGGLPEAVGEVTAAGMTDTAQFGQTLAMAENLVMAGSSYSVLAVGAPGWGSEQGVVKLFRRPSAGGRWTEYQTLGDNLGLKAGDGFGRSVSLSADGKWLAVGAPGDDEQKTPVFGTQFATEVGGGIDSGAVYVFQFNAGTAAWAPQGKLKAVNARAHMEYGGAVALNGDGRVLAVGAPFEDGLARGVYAFATTPATDATYDASRDPLAQDTGAVYVNTRTGTSWFFDSFIKPTPQGPAASNTTATAQARFGQGLALDPGGTVLAVGSPGASWNGSFAGAVQVFRQSSSTWSFQQDLALPSWTSSTAPGLRFGSALALSADAATLAVGDPEWNSPDGTLKAGAARVFAADSATGAWALQQTLQLPAEQLGAFTRFGSSLALAEQPATQYKRASSVLMVGAIEDDSGMAGLQRPDELKSDRSSVVKESGAAYRFRRLPAQTNWALQSRLKAPVPRVNAFFGTSVLMDSQGFDTLIGTRGASAAVYEY